MVKPTFVRAVMDYFGTDRRVTTDEFKGLTQADKQELYEGLQSIGIDCDEPKVK